MARKRLSEREVIDVLVAQDVAIWCPCPRCQEEIDGPRLIACGAQAIREHLHQLATGGADKPENWQYWHIACSKRKTSGTKATSAGSDAHARAKIRRLKGEANKRPKRKWPSRPFPKRKK